MKAFGKTIKEYRVNKNMTQEELAIDCDIERSLLSKIERGLTNTSLSHICAIADAFGIKPKELMDF